MLTRRAALAAPALLLGAAERLPLAAVPISRMQTPWWRKRFEAKQAEIRSRPIDLVWYGDSITQDWEESSPDSWRNFAPIWQHYYGDRRALNLGFRGDATSHLLWRLRHGETEGMRPKAAVILIGANNFGLVHWDAAQTLTGIVAVLAELRLRLPRMKLLLISVLPSIRSKWVSRQTVAVNKGLAERYGAPGSEVAYVDVTSLFLRDGQVDANRFLDPRLTPPDPPLHPTAQTQARMAAAIEPTLARLMGDAPKRPVE